MISLTMTMMKALMTSVIKTKTLKMTKILKMKGTSKRIKMATRSKIFCKSNNKEQDKIRQSY